MEQIEEFGINTLIRSQIGTFVYKLKLSCDIATMI